MPPPTPGSLTTAFVLTPRAIIGVQARISANAAEPVARATAEIPAGAIAGGVIHDIQRVAQAVRTLCRQFQAPVRSAAVVIPDASYSMRPLRVPPLPPDERRSVVRHELEQSGVLPFGGGSLDFFWLAESGSQGPVDACAYVTSDAGIESIRAALKQAGVRLAGVEPASVAMIRAHLVTGGARAVALLYPSEKHCDLCIHDGSTLRQLRRIPGGWADLPQGAGEALPSTEGRSGSVREHFGGFLGGDDGPEDVPAARDLPFPAAIWTDGEEVLVQEPAPPRAEAQPAARRVEIRDDEPTGPSLLDETPFVVSEVARSLAFYAREHPDSARPEELVVLGGTPGAHVFHRLLEDTQSIPVRGEPGSSEGQDAERAALGAACALRAVDAGVPRLDLAQQSAGTQARERQTVVVLGGMALSVLWLVASAAAGLVLMFLESGVQAEKARVAAEMRRINEARAPAVRQQQLSEAVDAMAAKSRVPVASVLGRLAAAANPGISVKNLQIGADGKLAIEGDATSTGDVQGFAFELGRGVSVVSPVLENVRRDTDGRLTFRVSGFAGKPRPVEAVAGGSKE